MAGFRSSNPGTCDIQFCFPGDHRHLSAHRLFLSTVSPVFLANFFGDWKDVRIIEILDTSYESFSQLLDFIYSSQAALPTSPWLLSQLYRLADFYILDSLAIKICKQLESWEVTECNFAVLTKVSEEMGMHTAFHDALLSIAAKFLVKFSRDFFGLSYLFKTIPSSPFLHQALASAHQKMKTILVSDLFNKHKNKHKSDTCSLDCYGAECSEAIFNKVVKNLEDNCYYKVTEVIFDGQDIVMFGLPREDVEEFAGILEPEFLNPAACSLVLDS